jgi:hypothetical protein
MMPWSFSEEGAAEKYIRQFQNNMWVTDVKEVAAAASSLRSDRTCGVRLVALTFSGVTGSF